MIDVTNKCAVTVKGNRVVILAFGRTLTANDALNLAAYLVVSAEMIQATGDVDKFDAGEEFDAWLQAVRST